MAEIVRVSAVTDRYPVHEIGNIPTVKILGGQMPEAHHSTHESGGNDEIAITALGGFPGGATKFLREDGSFETPAGGVSETSGTWTPVLGGTGGQSGQTYLAQHGYWRRIGNLVWVFGRVVLTAKGTITGNLEIQGLPVAINGFGGAYFGHAPAFWSALNTALTNMTIIGNTGATTAKVMGTAAATTSLVGSALTTSALTNTSEISFSMVYSA